VHLIALVCYFVTKVGLLQEKIVLLLSYLSLANDVTPMHMINFICMQ
jgi:hypothetical protein